MVEGARSGVAIAGADEREHGGIDWQFTRDDARIKLKHLCTAFET